MLEFEEACTGPDAAGTSIFGKSHGLKGGCDGFEGLGIVFLSTLFPGPNDQGDPNHSRPIFS
ncbi:MAG: hypothetical protein AAF533_16740, partial [Acidobacteriota bacterium]